MRIRSLENFLEYPPGTIFAKYIPHIFGDLSIKGESIPDTEDFLYISIADAIDTYGSEDFFILLDRATETIESIPMNFENMIRDGMFINDQLFSVWEVEDIIMFLGILLNAKKIHESLQILSHPKTKL